MVFAYPRNIINQLWPPRPSLTEVNVPSQAGRVFIVTGGNSGIGFELCRILYSTGAKVYVASRSEDKARGAIDSIVQATPPPKTPGELKFLQLDLNDLNSVKTAAASFAQHEAKLDVLWNNAGAGAFTLPVGAHTAQDLEPMVGMHCVATLLFTELLLPRLRAAAAANPALATRVVWTSSIAVEDTPPKGVELGSSLREGSSDRVRNYGVSKAGTWILGREFARRHGRDGIASVVQNPGNVRAGSYANAPFVMMLFLNRLLKEPTLGAYTELYAGLSPEILNDWAYVIPWGRVQPDRDLYRQDIVQATAPEVEGGLGYGEKLWEWCKEQWEPVVGKVSEL